MLDIPPEELEEMAGEKRPGPFCLGYCSPNPNMDKWGLMDGLILSLKRVKPGIKWPSAGNWVTDAGSGCRVCQLHNDKWPLLQRNHTQVLGIIRWFKEWPVAGPGWVPKPQYTILPPAYLGEQTRETWDKSTVHKQVFIPLSSFVYNDESCHLYFSKKQHQKQSNKLTLPLDLKNKYCSKKVHEMFTLRLEVN